MEVIEMMAVKDPAARVVGVESNRDLALGRQQLAAVEPHHLFTKFVFNSLPSA